MKDDIVTRLRNEWAVCQTCMAANEAADEIERLRKMLDAVLERENKDNARQLDIVRKVEVMSTDKWREIADDLYKQVCINFCWHCGHERTRECSAEEAVTRYRNAACDEQL